MVSHIMDRFIAYIKMYISDIFLYLSYSPFHLGAFICFTIPVGEGYVTMKMMVCDVTNVPATNVYFVPIGLTVKHFNRIQFIQMINININN